MQNTLNFDDDTTKRAWDDSYPDSSSIVLWSDAPVPYAEQAAALAAQNDVYTILDLPCGDGRNIPPLAAASSIIIAADSSMRAVNHTARLCQRAKIRNCIAVGADVFATGFAEEQFDLVFCWDLLGHLKEPRRALDELLRVTRTGGRLCVSVFALGDSTRGRDMEPIGSEQYIYRNRFYYRFYDRAGVTTLLSSLRGTIESVELATWTEPPHPGFREYTHEHQSWAAVLRKSGLTSR